jgi:hypothetical protein
MPAFSRSSNPGTLSTAKGASIRIAWLNLPARRPDAPRFRARTMRWLVLALLGGYLLFCHGCHGDEDNELLAAAGFPAAHGRGTSIGIGCASIWTCWPSRTLEASARSTS